MGKKSSKQIKTFYLSHSTQSFKKAQLGVSVSCAERMPFGSADVLSSGPGAFFWTWCFFWSRAVLDTEQKFDCARKSRSETENSALENPFLSFTPPCPCRKDRQPAEWFAARGGKAAHAEPSLLSAHKKRHFCIRSLPHILWEGKVSWEPAAWGPQLHTQAPSASFSPASPYSVTQ